MGRTTTDDSYKVKNKKECTVAAAQLLWGIILPRIEDREHSLLRTRGNRPMIDRSTARTKQKTLERGYTAPGS